MSGNRSLALGLIAALAVVWFPGLLGERDPEFSNGEREHAFRPMTPASSSASSLVAPVGRRAELSQAHRGELGRARRALQKALQEARDDRGTRSGVHLSLGPERLAAFEGARVLWRHPSAIRVAGVEHVPFELRKDGLPVFNRAGRLHTRGDRLERWTGATAFPPLTTSAARLEAEAAIDHARRLVGATALRGPVEAVRGWFARASVTVPAWRLTLPSWQPLGTWRVILDATDGSLLEIGDLAPRLTGTGRVYPENLVTTPVPSDLPLFELDGSGFLSGRLARVFDIRATEAFRPDAVFAFPEADPRFAQTAVYRGITDAARFAEAHGFPAFPAPIVAFTNLGFPSGEELNNAFYDPLFQLVFFGNGDGVLTAHIPTDVDVAAHELGHHLFQVLVDPTLATTLSSVAAINEGVADTIAALLNGNPAIAESVFPGQPFVRTLANARIFPDDVDLDPHLEGLIYAGLNWDLMQTLGADLFARILFAGLPFLPPDSILPSDYRDALLEGDRVANRRRARTEITAAASARGLDALEKADFAGILRLGQPESGLLSDGGVAVYLFDEFPGSRAVRARLRGTGDADLLVAPLATFNPDDPRTFVVSQRVGSTTEAVDILRSTRPSVDDDDAWLVAVLDFSDGRSSSYTVQMDADLPEPAIAPGGSLVDALDVGGEVDLFTFAGTQGAIVRLEGTASTDGLDLAVAVFDPFSIEVLGGDDDSGPGLDPLIQGVRLPETKTYALAVFSPIADIDPTVGTGSYEIRMSLCDNRGPDPDGDGLANDCDDDDDDDGFVDAQDTSPGDPHLCFDAEPDGCDDCSGGSFDFLQDGPDADGDAFCDAGDPDDDNDGCEDSLDPAPFVPSTDADLDFVGLDCDNCADDFNPDQTDTDGDGLGDPCDPTPMPEPGGAVVLLAALMLRRWTRGRLSLRRRAP